MTIEEYLERLLAGDADACVTEGRSRAVNLEGLEHLYLDLIEPSQYRVGELWEAGRISVAREHLATAINRYVMSACYAPLARATTGGQRAVITCTPGESHELGARMLADLLECDGWDVDFYGASMPAGDLAAAIRQSEPRFVGLSTALVMHLGFVKRSITTIRETLGPLTPPIVVGGHAYREGADLWRQVGADLYAADPATAIPMLRRLKG